MKGHADRNCQPVQLNPTGDRRRLRCSSCWPWRSSGLAGLRRREGEVPVLLRVAD